MKIAYIIYPQVIISNRSNGVRSQAIEWAKMLSDRGHDVALVNNWNDYNWNDFDAIHVFGGGSWILGLVSRLCKLNSNILWSPIVDPTTTSKGLINDKIKCVLNKLTRGTFRTTVFEQTKSIPFIKSILTRSQFEADYVHWLYNVPKDKIQIIPLSYSTSCQPYEDCEKENFCLHISSIYQPRKNVVNLIKAARKFGFHLVLAGNKGTIEQYKIIQDAIGDSQNIEVLGFINEEEKINLYKKAKVFALPSKTEGVGIVAVDAAYYGCEIVITNIPGPKEYYNEQCIEVDPYDVDEIGNAIQRFLGGKETYQPQLSKYISDNYSHDCICDLLEAAYNNVTK